MNKNNIIELLKSVSYPGYSRDIVSFGILEEITIDDTTVTIRLKLNSDLKVKEEIQKNIILLLKEKNPEIVVNVTFNESSEKIKVSSDIKALKDVKHIIAIASGKGGVGKSTTTVNLAAVLSKKFKVGILDLDI